jgi:hypothetical protein
MTRRRIWWRPAGRIWHAYRDYRRGVYHALCDGRITDATIYSGARVFRPPVLLRCAWCDLREIELHDADASLPETSGWEELARRVERERK